MTFDGRLELRIAFQEVRGLRERRASVGTNISLVVVEIGIEDSCLPDIIGRRPFGLLRRRRSVDRVGCSCAGGAARTTGSTRVGWRDGLRALGRAFGIAFPH